jgi:hypothetical protein
VETVCATCREAFAAARSKAAPSTLSHPTLTLILPSPGGTARKRPPFPAELPIRREFGLESCLIPGERGWPRFAPTIPPQLP